MNATTAIETDTDCPDLGNPNTIQILVRKRIAPGKFYVVTLTVDWLGFQQGEGLEACRKLGECIARQCDAVMHPPKGIF